MKLLLLIGAATVMLGLLVWRGLSGLYNSLYGVAGGDNLTITGTLTCNGAIIATAGIQNQAPSVVSVPAATTTLTVTQALHAGKIIQVQSTGGLAATLPAPTGTGAKYTFVVAATITGGAFTIDAKGGDASAVFNGTALQTKTGTGLTSTGVIASCNEISLNGTTTGGIIGDIIEIVDIATHSWNVFINGQYTGTFSTPFLNH